MRVQTAARFKSFSELKDFIYITLCKREQFAIDAFPMTERVLKQGSKTCGFLFSIYGPRSVVCNAVFETGKNAIHFYSSSGERVMTTPVELLCERIHSANGKASPDQGVFSGNCQS